MGALAAERAVIVIIGAGLIFAAAGFAGYAIMLALIVPLGTIAAAAATAALLMVLPLSYVAIAALRRPPPKVEAEVQELTIDTAVLSALALAARDKPLIAVLGAGLFGAAGMLLKGRR